MTGRTRAALLVLPLLYLASALWLREASGPYWAWHATDPSYFYLFDALNQVNLQAPGHVGHPGIPLHWLGALIVWAMHPGQGAAAIIKDVLADPEFTLHVIGTVFFVMNAGALLFAGWAGRVVFGDLGPAMVLQAGPLLSSVVMRHGMYVKPESMLVFVAAMLIGLTVLAMRSENRDRAAVGFGLLAGFGVAVKATAAPLFLLPLFLLWEVRPLITYAAVSFAALIVFALPAIGAWDLFFDYAGRLATHSGHFGEGKTGFLDAAEYLHNFRRMLARPVMFAPLFLGLAAVIWAVLRRRAGKTVPMPELRALAGFVLAQFATVALVAKHPSAHYLVPAYVVAALGIALLWRTVAGFGIGSDAARQRGHRATVALMAAILVAQGFAVVKQHDELAEWRAESETVDSRAFDACVRVHFQFADDPVYALMYGNFITRGKRSAELAAVVPPGDYWFDIVSGTFRDAAGETDIRAALKDARCVLFRGSDWSFMDAYLKATLPELKLEGSCSTPHEHIRTVGVDCTGTPSATDR